MSAVNITFNANTAPAISQIEALKKTMNSLEANMAKVKAFEMANVDTAMRNTLSQIKDFGSGQQISLATPIQQADKLTQKINQGKISWEEFKQAARRGSSVAAEQFALQQLKFGEITRKPLGEKFATLDYSGIDTGIKKMEAFAMQTKVAGAATTAFSQNLVDMGKNMAFSARQLTISLTAPLAIGAGISMKTYKDIETQLIDIAKVYGGVGQEVEMTNSQIKQSMIDLSEGMSKDYGAKMNDTFDYSKYFAQQGQVGTQLESSVRGATELQLLGDVDTEDAQKAITTLTNVYGVNANEMSKYVSYMNAIEDSTTLTMQDYAQALPKIGPIVNTFEKDTTKAMQSMSIMLEAGKRGGITSATEIANAWKSIYAKVSKPTFKLQDTWDALAGKYGIDKTFTGITRSNNGNVLEIVKEISELTADWSDPDKNQLFAQLAGAEQVARMTTFAQQLSKGSDTIDHINQTLENDPDALLRNAKEQMDQIVSGPGARWNQLMNEVQRVGFIIGAKVFPPIMTVLEHVVGLTNTLVDKFSALPSFAKTFLGSITAVAALAGPITAMIGAGIQFTGFMGMLSGRGIKGIGNVMGRMAGGPKELFNIINPFGGKLNTQSDQVNKLTKKMVDENIAVGAIHGLDLNKELTAVARQYSNSVNQAINPFNSAVIKAASSLGTLSTVSQSSARKTQSIANSAVYSDPNRMVTKTQGVWNPRQVKSGLTMDEYRAAQMDRQVQRALKNPQMSREHLSDDVRNAVIENERIAQRQKDLENRRIQQEKNRQARIDADAAREAAALDYSSGLKHGISSTNNRAVVETQQAYVATDLAKARNDIAFTKDGSAKRAMLQAKINSLLVEQDHLQKVASGSASGIAQAADQIRKKYGQAASEVNNMNGGMRKFVSVQNALRNEGEHVVGSDTISASERKLLSGSREQMAWFNAIRSDPSILDKYKDDQNAKTEIPIGKNKDGSDKGVVHMSPALYKMGVEHSEQIKQRHEKIEKIQGNISKNSDAIVSKFSMIATVIGVGTAMLGEENEMLQMIGTTLSTVGAATMMFPEQSAKLFESFAKKSVSVFNNLGQTVGSVFARVGGEAGQKMASGLKTNVGNIGSWVSKNAGALMGWGAAIAAAMVAMKMFYDWSQKKSEEAKKKFDEHVASSQQLADTFGYRLQQGFRTQTALPDNKEQSVITDEIKETSEKLKEIPDYQATLDGLKGFTDAHNQVQLDKVNALLRPKAIQILGEGGTPADVQKMVTSTLYAAGVNEAVIKDFKFKIDTSNMEVLLPQNDINNITGDLIGERNKKDFWGRATSTAWNRISDPWATPTPGAWGVISNAAGTVANMLDYHLPGQKTAEEKINSQYNIEAAQLAADNYKQIANAYNAASTVEAKMEIATKLGDMIRDANKEAMSKHGVEKERAKMMMHEFAKNIAEGEGSQWLDDQGKGVEMIQASPLLAQTMIEPSGAIKSATDAAARYKQITDELAAAGVELNDEQRANIANSVRQAAGMQEVAYSANQTREEIERFVDATGEIGKVRTPQEMLSDFNAPSRDDIDRVNALNDALNNVPPEFSKRWSFQIDYQNDPQGAAEKYTEMLRGAGTDAMARGSELALKEFDKNAQRTLDGIRSSGESQLKALESQQKASEKAFKNEEKALSQKHKAQTKALDAQIKEEEKQFDKQQKAQKKEFDKKQKEEKKQFDKKQKEESKQFEKGIEKEKKDFDKKWKNQEDQVKNFYDASRKYVEDQQNAEDALDEKREKNAERERKRQEMLQDLQNKNVDINVAIAGGNLDEAAKLVNDAAATTSSYYSDQWQEMGNQESDDRRRARDARLSGLDEQQNLASEYLGTQKEKDTEVFNDSIDAKREAFSEKQSDAADAFGEKQADESDAFQEKLNTEKEQWQQRMDARREQLQAEQEQEMEFLNQRREAMQEYYAQQRDAIQATTDAAIKSQQDINDAQRRGLEQQLELLKTEIPKNEQEVRDAAARMEGIMNQYGINLEALGTDLHGNMMNEYHHALDVAAAEIRNDQKWVQVGSDIGAMIAAGMHENIDSTQFLQMVLSGLDLTDKTRRTRDDNAFADVARGGVPRRATGGPIIGPGTGTSDSILALLSNGEHVLTAAEVNALGGHARVEQLRQAIMSGNMPAFASGGAVGGGASQSFGAKVQSAGVTVSIDPTGSGDLADGGVIAAVSNDIENLGNNFDAALTQTATPAWQLFGDQLIKVKQDSIDPVMEGFRIAQENLAAQTTNTTAGIMTPAWMTFAQNLDIMRQTVWDLTMQSMNAGLDTLGNHTVAMITQQMMPMWTQGAGHIANMHNSVIEPTMAQTRSTTTATAQNFGTAADQIGVGWGRVRNNVAEPVKFTVNTVYNEGLVGMWNKVAEKLDLDPFEPHTINFATGGVLPGYTPGRDVHEFSSPTGGRLHLSGGEAIMRPEWTRAVGGPAAVNRMNADAKNGRLALGSTSKNHDRAYYDGGVVQRFAEGGVVKERRGRKNKDDNHSLASNDSYGMPTGTNIGYGEMGRFPNWVYNIAGQFGLMAATYPGHQESEKNEVGYAPNPGHTNRGIDWSGPVPLMQRFAEYLIVNGPRMPQLEQVIWMNPYTGQRLGWHGGFLDTTGYYASDYPGHQNHVHTRQSASLDGSGSMEGVTPEILAMLAAGGGGLGAMAIQLMQEFNDAKKKVQDQIDTWMEGDGKNVGIPIDIPQYTFDDITAAMSKKIQALLPMLGGGSSGTPIDWSGLPADIQGNIELGKWAAEQVGWTGAEWEALKELWWNESGWNNNAQNPTSTAYGIAQFLDSTWAPYGPKTSDPKKQIEYGIRYIQGRPDYGTPSRALALWKSRSPHWYDDGGIASGKGFLAKNVIEPERVLSPRQTKSFDRMVDVLDNNFGSSVRRSPSYDSASVITHEDYMSKINDLDRSKLPIPQDEQRVKTYEEMTKMLQPIFSAFQSFIQQTVVPGVMKYTTELIQMKTDEERIKKIGDEVTGAINESTIQNTGNEVNMVFGGTVFGDQHLIEIMEKYKQDILAQVAALQDEAIRRVSGK